MQCTTVLLWQQKSVAKTENVSLKDSSSSEFGKRRKERWSDTRYRINLHWSGSGRKCERRAKANVWLLLKGQNNLVCREPLGISPLHLLAVNFQTRGERFSKQMSPVGLRNQNLLTGPSAFLSQSPSSIITFLKQQNEMKKKHLHANFSFVWSS